MTKETNKTPVKKKIPDNVVFVGRKEVMSYVMAVVTQFGNGQKTVTLKARGNTISRAVDCSEIVRNRFISDLKDTQDIKASTENIKESDGFIKPISCIEITLSKQSK